MDLSAQSQSLAGADHKPLTHHTYTIKERHSPLHTPLHNERYYKDIFSRQAKEARLVLCKGLGASHRPTDHLSG